MSSPQDGQILENLAVPNLGYFAVFVAMATLYQITSKKARTMRLNLPIFCFNL